MINDRQLRPFFAPVFVVCCLFGWSAVAGAQPAPSPFDLRAHGARQASRLLANPGPTNPAPPAQDRNVFGDFWYAARTTVTDAGYIYSSPARLDKGSALKLGAFLGLGGLIYAFDQEIFDAVKRNQDGTILKPLRQLGDEVEFIGDGSTMPKYYIGGLLVGYVSGWDRLTWLTADLVETYYIAGLVKNVSNKLTGRARPAAGKGPYFFELNEGTSFPSGHSSNIMQTASILSHHVDFLPFTIAAYTVAGSVFVQRLTGDGHWPSDVYVGAVYGWLIAEEIVKRNRNRRLTGQPIISVDDDSHTLGFMLTLGL